MNKSTRIMLLLTAQSISILVLAVNALSPFPQVLTELLVYISSSFVGCTVAELMSWDTRKKF